MYLTLFMSSELPPSELHPSELHQSSDTAYSKPDNFIYISSKKIIEDLKITASDGGNNTTQLQIELPSYFNRIDPKQQQIIIDVLAKQSVNKPIIQKLQK